MGTPKLLRFALPLQVAAVCYRFRGPSVEFLLVQNSGGTKWTFPKGAPEPRMSYSRAAEKEAWEEAGVRGRIESKHFHLYMHTKGVFWKQSGVREFVVKAFLMEVLETGNPHEADRNPTWFLADNARKILARGREPKYVAEIQLVIDRAMERIVPGKMVSLGRANDLFPAAIL